MPALQGKIAVITGGNSEIGLAVAKRFVAEGAFVFITGRRQAELDRAVKEIGKNVLAVGSRLVPYEKVCGRASISKSNKRLERESQCKSE